MIQNFLFHRVSPHRDSLWDPMDVDLFEKCIKHIIRKYQVELFENIAFDKNILVTKNKLATIMFDDGYKDNIEYALPILEKYNVKASFYVVTDSIDKNIPTWTHSLEYSFQKTKQKNLDLKFEFLPKEYRSAYFVTEQDKLKFVSKLKPFLKTIDHHKRIQVLDRIKAVFNDVELPKLMMSWNDLRQLKDAGHYIGSHTVTHSMLATISNEIQIMNELTESRNRIQEQLGFKTITISYPIGSYDNRVVMLSQQAGYKIGLAVKQNVYNPKKDNIFEVPRIELYNEPWLKTKMRISNRLEQIKKIIRYK